MDYVEYWKLTEKPFEERCDTRFFFESEDHREALDRMLYVVNDRNMSMGLLTGEVGSGKTITKTVLTGSLSSHHFEVVSFDTSDFPFVDLVYDVLRRITFRDPELARAAAEPPPRGDRYLLITELRSRLERLVYREKRHLVLIFDEAQQMDEEVLDEVRGLTNLSSGTESYLTVFLVGQPELGEKVRRLKQVDQRIFLRFHLNNLDSANTQKYIQHRLRVAGLERDSIFSSLAYELIYRSTRGVPREINRLCKLALTYGFAHDATEVRREDIEVIIDDYGKQR